MNSKEKIKTWYRILKNWIIPVFGLLLFILILSQISFKEFINVITRIDIRFFIIGFIAGFTSTVFRTIRYAYYFPARERWFSLYGAFALSRLMYFALPFNSGDLVYLNVLKKYRFSPSIAETAPVWILLRLTDVIALSIWLIIALTIIPVHGKLYEEMNTYRWLIIGICLIMMIFILAIPFWINRIPFKSSNSWLSDRLQAIRAGINRTLGFNIFLRTLLVSFFIWASIISSTIFSQLAFNTPLTFSECFLASVATLVVTLLPINPPLGLGTGDAAWVGVMMLAGVDSSLAISLAISIRLFSMLNVFTEGLFGYLILMWNEHYLASKKQVEV